MKLMIREDQNQELKEYQSTIKYGQAFVFTLIC